MKNTHQNFTKKKKTTLTKVEVTKKILELINPTYTEEDFKTSLRIWWFNKRTKKVGGLRLSQDGFEAFEKSKIVSYRIKAEEKIKFTNELSIWLDRKMETPFYIHPVVSRAGQIITVYDQKTAFQLMVFSGNFNKLYLSKKRNEQLSNQPS